MTKGIHPGVLSIAAFAASMGPIGRQPSWPAKDAQHEPTETDKQFKEAAEEKRQRKLERNRRLAAKMQGGASVA